MMLADGRIDPVERALLSKFATARNISEPRLELIIKSVADGTMKPEIPDDRTLGTAYLNAMATMCLADGKISSQELELLHSVGSKMGFDETEINSLIERLRQNLLEKLRKRK